MNDEDSSILETLKATQKELSELKSLQQKRERREATMRRAHYIVGAVSLLILALFLFGGYIIGLKN